MICTFTASLHVHADAKADAKARRQENKEAQSARIERRLQRMREGKYDTARLALLPDDCPCEGEAGVGGRPSCPGRCPRGGGC
jgi:hypothetical protein